MNNYEPSDVLIHVREPYNKNTLWIKPNKDSFEIKIYLNGWKTIYSSKDIVSVKEEVNNYLDKYDNTLNDKLKKHLGQVISNTIILKEKEKELEQRVQELESKIDKLVKRYASLI